MLDTEAKGFLPLTNRTLYPLIGGVNPHKKWFPVKRVSEDRLTKFHKWLVDNRYSNKQFAERMREQLGAAEFSDRTVEKWRYGKAIPHTKNMAAIKAITGRALTADDFMEAAT